MLTQAVVGGSVDIAQNGYTPAAAAAVQGADIVFIGGISNKLPFQLVVEDIDQDRRRSSRARAIAISRFGSSTDQAADFALKHLGLTRNDVHILQLGGAGHAHRGRDERADRRHHGAISRHRRGHAPRLPCAGRCHRRRRRLSRTRPLSPSRAFLKKQPGRRQAFLHGDGHGRARVQAQPARSPSS